ncbi:MAG: glycosyltransferase family 4 protein [Microscillaceae bacterium]|nr:glycosyltransferase family 4 protein [Microscillaceae bacterium]
MSFWRGLWGRFDPGKGQEYLIEALALLRHEGLPIEILLLGEETKGEEGRYLPYLKKQVQQKGLEPFVHFRPFTRQIAQAYASLDVFCMTSKAETFGMVTVEAMASGLPVIGTASGGTPELIQAEETGILIPPLDAKALARAIAYLYQNPEKAQRMGLSAQASVEARFHYRVQVAQTQALLQKLMERL